MAITTTNSNHFKYQLGVGNIDFANDTFKMILMDTSFTFDKDTHATLGNVTANQIATGNGYTQDSITLVLDGTPTEDDTNDIFSVAFNNVTITALGGAIEDFTGVIVYDDTSADKTVLFYTDLDTTISLSDGLSFIASNISIEIA